MTLKMECRRGEAIAKSKKSIILRIVEQAKVGFDHLLKNSFEQSTVEMEKDKLDQHEKRKLIKLKTLSEAKKKLKTFLFCDNLRLAGLPE